MFGEARARNAAEVAEVAGRVAAEGAAEATRRAVASGGEDSVLDPGTMTVVQLQVWGRVRYKCDSTPPSRAIKPYSWFMTYTIYDVIHTAGGERYI